MTLLDTQPEAPPPWGIPAPAVNVPDSIPVPPARSKFKFIVVAVAVTVVALAIIGAFAPRGSSGADPTPSSGWTHENVRSSIRQFNGMGIDGECVMSYVTAHYGFHEFLAITNNPTRLSGLASTLTAECPS